VINFVLKIFINYVKGELFGHLSIFVPLLYQVAKIFPHKVTVETKLNTDPNSRNDALQPVILGF